MYGSSVAWVQHWNREQDNSYSLQFTKFCHFWHNFNECSEHKKLGMLLQWQYCTAAARLFLQYALCCHHEQSYHVMLLLISLHCSKLCALWGSLTKSIWSQEQQSCGHDKIFKSVYSIQWAKISLRMYSATGHERSNIKIGRKMWQLLNHWLQEYGCSHIHQKHEIIPQIPWDR